MPASYSDLIHICDEILSLLAKEQEPDSRRNVAEACSKLFTDIKPLGLSVTDLAGWLKLSHETAYRWKSVDKGKGPKAVYIQRLREIFSERVTEVSPDGTAVRIGVPPFWDAALITSFEAALRSHGINPMFVSVSHMLRGLHRAFWRGDIDVAIHNNFLIEYDLSQNESKRQGLTLHCPLYEFSGYFIYGRRDYIRRKLQGSHKGIHVEDILKELQAVSDGVLQGRPKATELDNNILTSLLDRAHVGVERGTGMELAFRKIYGKAGLEFDKAASVNLRNDQMYDLPINDVGNDPNTADTRQAFDSFLEGNIDLFCGGLAHHFYLQQQNESMSVDPPRSGRRQDRSGPEYLVLFGPSPSHNFESNVGPLVSSFNGLVARADLSPDMMRTIKTIGQVWRAGVSQFQEWSRAARGEDEAAKSLAIIHLSAMMRGVEAYTSAGTYTPSGVRIAVSDITQTAKWPLWVDEWQKEIKYAAGEKEQAETLDQFARKVIDLYRQDWRRRVWQWTALLTANCEFYVSEVDGMAAYTSQLTGDRERTPSMDDQLKAIRERLANDPGEDFGLRPRPNGTRLSAVPVAGPV